MSRAGIAPGRTLRRVVPLLALAAFGWSCTHIDAIQPGAPSWGRADLSRLVILGDSFAAGIQSGGLVGPYQKSSFVAVFARQAGAPDFEIPEVAPPGVPIPLVITSLSPLTIISPPDNPALYPGRFINLGLARPYNNLAIPGANAADQLTTSLIGDPTQRAFYLYAPLILRPQGGAVSALDQAAGLDPTFAVIEVGINDVLSGVTSGNPGLITPFADFRNSYLAILDRLQDSSDPTPISGAALVDIPAPTDFPYMNTVPWYVVNPATNEPPPGPLFPLIGMVNGQAAPLPEGSLVSLEAVPLLQQGIGIPAALGGTGQPLPDDVVLDNAPDGELTRALQKVSQMNDFIRATAVSRGFALVDVEGLLRSNGESGLVFGGVEFTTDYVTGGFFSLDGIHPSNLGQAVAGNLLIEAVNGRYGASIPLFSFHDNPYFDLVKGGPAQARAAGPDPGGLAAVRRLFAPPGS